MLKMSPLLVFHLLKFNCFSFFFWNQSLFSFFYFILYIYVFICLMSKILIIEQQKFKTPGCKHKQGRNHVGVGPPTFLKIWSCIYMYTKFEYFTLDWYSWPPFTQKIYKLALETPQKKIYIDKWSGLPFCPIVSRITKTNLQTNKKKPN